MSIIRVIKKAFFSCSVLLLLSSCAIFGDRLVLRESKFNQIQGWENDNHAEALVSFLNSCKKFYTLPEKRNIHKSGLGGKYGNWREICDKAVYIKTTDAKEFFEANFIPYLATNWGNSKGTFTGYFEIGLEGSRTKHGLYQHPIYKKPSDIKDGQSYYSRKEIDAGAIAGKGLEIAWVKDPVRAFFLHVQGSGRIKMDDGSVLRVGYDGKNGHKYVSIGKYMIENGYIKEEEISAQSIKAWLYSHPEQAFDVLNENPSYVFFREIGTDGPIGGQGVPLTPMRSLAIDSEFVPYGAPVWVDVDLNGGDKKQFKKLLIAQDTGAAIRGPVRGDLFFGYGDSAEELAGYQNNIGKYFILLPAKKSL